MNLFPSKSASARRFSVGSPDLRFFCVLALGIGAGTLGGPLLAAGHREGLQSKSAATVAMGTYRAVLTLPAGELPFGLELSREGTPTVGYLLNGRERVPLREATVAGTHLEIRMPGYENRLTADVIGDELQGEVALTKSGGKQQHIPLHAKRGQTYRFFPKAAGRSRDVSGRWAVKFTDDVGKAELAVGEFVQSHDVVTGTFLAETGDHRYLAGQVQGDELYLSTFDGAHAFLYKAKLTSAGVLAGSWCPNCHDEAAFLEPLYRQYRGKGVEIVSLMFEHFGDFPRAAEAAQRFRAHYGIDYTTLIAGISDKDEAGEKLPMLDRVYGFPTTIFIDRQGDVRKIHTGFSGPATGAHYTQLVDEVKAALHQLLAES